MIKLRMYIQHELLSIVGKLILSTNSPKRLQRYRGWSRALLARQMADRARAGIQETVCHTSWSFGTDDDIPRR